MAVDGTNLVHRYYHALESTQLRNSDGVALWAVHGVLGGIAKYLEATQASSLVVGFDMAGGCSSRKALAPSYKQGRAQTPDELRSQLAASRELLELCGIVILEVHDWEADDVLASCVARVEEADNQAVIVSSDKDAHQLVSERVVVYKPEGTFVDDAALVAKYKISGKRWVEYAALIGEGADNLAGVNGIGPARAAKIINHFDDVETAIAQPDALRGVVGDKVTESLLDGVEVFRRNRQVGTLRRDLELDLSKVKLTHLDPEWIRLCALGAELGQAGARLAGAVERTRRANETR